VSNLRAEADFYHSLLGSLENDIDNWNKKYGIIKILENPQLHEERLKLQEALAYAHYRYRANFHDFRFYSSPFSQEKSQAYTDCLEAELFALDETYKPRGGPAILYKLTPRLPLHPEAEPEAKPEEVYPILERIFVPTDEYPTIKALVGIYLDIARRADIGSILSKD